MVAPCSGRAPEEQSVIGDLRVSVTQERLKSQSLEMDVSAERDISSKPPKELEACQKDLSASFSGGSLSGHRIRRSGDCESSITLREKLDMQGAVMLKLSDKLEARNKADIAVKKDIQELREEISQLRRNAEVHAAPALPR